MADTGWSFSFYRLANLCTGIPTYWLDSETYFHNVIIKYTCCTWTIHDLLLHKVPSAGDEN